MVNVGSDWALSTAGGLDVLTKLSDTGRDAKKVHINTCDYRPRKIEYFDTAGSLVVAVKLAGYTNLSDEVSVPASINITHYNSGEIDSVVDIKLRNVKLFEPTQKMLEGRLFKPPLSKGFEHIFELNENCEFIRQ